MKSLVVFDSYFGNTKKVADAIASQLGEGVKVISVDDVRYSDMEGISLLIVGSPILGWKPSEKTEKLLGSLPKERLYGVKAAAFDTRVKLFIHGDAAHKISKALEGAGVEIISEPRAFYVKGKEGPLFEGETERAERWGREIKEKIQ